MVINEENKWFAVNGEWFDIQFSDFAMSKEGEKIRSYLNSKKYKVSDTDETYRVINSWSDSGLLLDEGERTNGWRKFSLLDLHWLQIIKELRTLGLGLDKINTLKSYLFKNDSLLNFGFFIAQTIGKQDIILIMTPTGEGCFLREQEYYNFQRANPLPNTFIVISLNKIYADLVKKPELRNKNEKLKMIPVDDREINILSKIAFEPELKEVNIKSKNRKIDKVYYKKHKDNVGNVDELVRNFRKAGGNGDLVIKKQDGKLVAVEQIDKT